MKMENLIPANEGRLDRVLRVVLGIALLALVFVGPRTYWGLLGLVPLATGLVGSCPIYTALGISTCRRRGTKDVRAWTGGARIL